MKVPARLCPVKDSIVIVKKIDLAIYTLSCHRFDNVEATYMRTLQQMMLFMLVLCVEVNCQIHEPKNTYDISDADVPTDVINRLETPDWTWETHGKTVPNYDMVFDSGVMNFEIFSECLHSDSRDVGVNSKCRTLGTPALYVFASGNGFRYACGCVV